MHAGWNPSPAPRSRPRGFDRARLLGRCLPSASLVALPAASIAGNTLRFVILECRLGRLPTPPGELGRVERRRILRLQVEGPEIVELLQGDASLIWLGIAREELAVGTTGFGEALREVERVSVENGVFRFQRGSSLSADRGSRSVRAE